jgi:diadenosine tetraphosphate (Ap4A) HIT family hydrolase/predicted house-cleaning noncanonical NTP pyrophosphatase (MazG superfamily)
MVEKCFFCDVQKRRDDKIIIENKDFFSRYDDFPISKGHVEVIPKRHIRSFVELSPGQLKSFFNLLKKTKIILQEKFNPDGFNIGINEGESAGQSIPHLHIHVIPRYRGDVKNPRGGVRNIFPDKADYVPDAQKIPSLKNYFQNKIVYNKLIRDRIPEIIEKGGKNPIVHVASDTEYWKSLREKLKEEVLEFDKDSSMEEFADVLEVLNAIGNFKKFSREDVKKIKEEKAEKRGRFRKRLILDEVN